MTYREKIQQLESEIDAINGAVNGLRDYASPGFEKDLLNSIRQKLFTVSALFSDLDNRISDNRASMEL